MGVETIERASTDPYTAGLNEEQSIDVYAMGRALIRSRRVILRTTLIMSLVSIALAFVLKPKFTSEVSFIPPPAANSSSIAAALAGQMAMLGGSDLGGLGKTSGDLYSGILRSRSVTSELVSRFHLVQLYGVKKESQAEKILDSSTTITVDPKSSIISVSTTQSSPALAHDIAAAYMDALRQTEDRLALTQAAQRRLFFGEQLAKEKDALADAEVEMKRTEEQSGLIAPTGQTEAEIRTIADTQAQIAARQVQLAALREAATDQNPDIVRLRSQIADLQAQLQRLESGPHAGSATATAGIPTSKVPEIQLAYIRKERDVKYHEALFDMLAKQYEAARLDEAREAPIMQVLDLPSYPDSRSGPKRLYIILAGFFLGLFGSSLWALTREGIRDALLKLRAA